MKKLPNGIPPAVALINPKYPHNVGGVLRACSCFGINQLWWTGDRVTLDIEKGQRLPREERMRGYQDVEMVRSDHKFLDRFESVTPIAVEVRATSENLFDFEHPENAVYIFGPEDGSLPKGHLMHCHRFIIIPTAHCLNLSSAVTTVLYDRALKRHWNGIDSPKAPNEYLKEERSKFGIANEENTALFTGISKDGMGKMRKD